MTRRGVKELMIAADQARDDELAFACRLALAGGPGSAPWTELASAIDDEDSDPTGVHVVRSVP